MNRYMGIRVIALSLPALLGACAFGPKVSSFSPASSPQGMSVTVRVADRELRAAELLEVGDSAVLVLTARRELVRIYYLWMRSFEPQHGSLLRGGSWPHPEDIKRWRALSRFPQGLTQPQVDTLLSFYGRPAVEVWR